MPVSFVEPTQDAAKAQFAHLSPISFLNHAATRYPRQTALVHGTQSLTWSETKERCMRLASALRARGLKRGDVVSVIAPNVPTLYELHFAVPMAGGVLNGLNTRLTADELAFQLRHGGARVLFVDWEYEATVMEALNLIDAAPSVFRITDEFAPEDIGVSELVDYEALVLEGEIDAIEHGPEDEREPIALNYTSGTTGDPKGVITHHRGAHLSALAQIISWSMPHNPVYLWTLPMFHCNGWSFPWAIAAQGGTNIFLRRMDPSVVVDLIETQAVTHMCGAPVVYSILIEELGRRGAVLQQPVNGLIAGAAPSVTLMESAERAGFVLRHVYGLTEVYGPSAVCLPQPEWAAYPLEEQARLNARQGFAMLSQDSMSVLDPETMKAVPADGKTIGEIMFRGNATMAGYLDNPDATEAAFAGGWFHTGDLAVIDPDGYVRITDRSKDVIISGGENVSSLEVEEILQQHPLVLYAAVVAKADDRWGEIPVAFIETRTEQVISSAELTAFCRSRLAGFKTPKTFVIGPIPRTSTGKIRKPILRDLASKLP